VTLSFGDFKASPSHPKRLRFWNF